MRYIFIALLLFSCTPKQQRTQGKETTETLTVGAVTVWEGDTIRCYQDEKSNDYYLQYLGNLYLIPHHFIVRGDTISANYFYLKKGVESLKLEIAQGNARVDEYEIVLQDKPFLNYIRVLYNDEKIDSILVGKTLPADAETLDKINTFINKI